MLIKILIIIGLVFLIYEIFSRFSGFKKNRQVIEKEGNIVESMANLMAENLDMDAQSDYVLESRICSGIDNIANANGKDALDYSTAVLNKNGDASVIYSNPIFKEEDCEPLEIESYFHLKDYDKIEILKETAGKRDDGSYMIVDMAGKEILQKLKNKS